MCQPFHVKDQKSCQNFSGELSYGGSISVHQSGKLLVMGKKVSVSEDAARSNTKVLFYITSPTYMYFWDALFAVG